MNLRKLFTRKERKELLEKLFRIALYHPDFQEKMKAKRILISMGERKEFEKRQKESIKIMKEVMVKKIGKEKAEKFQKIINEILEELIP